jgi:hypothetical protein
LHLRLGIIPITTTIISFINLSYLNFFIRTA